MYRVVEISGNVLNGSERERFSDAIHLARETEYSESELETFYHVQALEDGKWVDVPDDQPPVSVQSIFMNGALYSFSSEGFTVHAQENQGANLRVVRGIIAASPQQAIVKSKEWLGICKPHNVKVYRGDDGYYSADECIYQEGESN